ncbi:Hypothetical protein, putative [Bodo saltans]|uniref:Membrane-associated protein n=1 Tax=Bodo saltans TaxID=75058 RepID=A0A0S4J781_BODSA|nr:Hypothetical protein, putative [Bodo saltans]|eukprot:CUG87096.1 Hypothetical protein, putative [Bodo saltans]
MRVRGGTKLTLCISVALLDSLFFAIQPGQVTAPDEEHIREVIHHETQNFVQAPSGDSPTAAAPVLYVDGLYGPTLTLTESEQRIVAKRQQNRVTPAKCPHKYLFVNTHTYGRHHNQLQEMMHLAAWAQRLGRTAVLGWFRFSRRWGSSSRLLQLQ